MLEEIPISDDGDDSDSDDKARAQATMAQKEYGMKRVATQFHRIIRLDDVPVNRIRGTPQEEERQAKNTREATKALKDRLKDEHKKFDGSEIFGMVSFIIVVEEILETYTIEEATTTELQSPDAITVMFNNLQGGARAGSVIKRKWHPMSLEVRVF